MIADDDQPHADFEAWYHREHPRVSAALAVAGGDVEVAREATDEAFVRAYERWSRVRVMKSPGGWLYRVALNELRRRFRRQTIERELLRRQHRQQSVPAPTPVADPLVWEAVRGLPSRQRHAIALRYVLDLTEREVAATMGVSRGAASATLTAARKNLQTTLGESLTEDAPAPPANRPSTTEPPDSQDHHPTGTAAIDG